MSLPFGIAVLVQEEAQVEAAVGPEFEPFLPGLVLLLPLLGFLVNGALALASARRAADAVRAGGEWVLPDTDRPATHTFPSLVGPGVMLAAFTVVLVNFLRMRGAELHEPVVVSYWDWIVTGTFQVAAAIQLDQLSIMMMMVVTGVGFLIHVFSVGYMKDDPGYPRYFAYLNLFVFFMLTLVMGASFPIMFVGWEGVGLASYLLIGFWFKDREKADAGKKAFIVNRIGDFGFLIALFLLFVTFGTLDFAAVFAAAPEQLAYGGALVTAVTLFLLLGATGKSAQIPLYVWLPDAMAGPTPVSALIHAATMVTAGVYMVTRSSVLFALAPTGSLAVAGIGALTALFAATIALAQYDIKKVLAYSTVSQLGYMFLGVGVGAYTAGVFHLMTHAFFKGAAVPGIGGGHPFDAPRPPPHPQALGRPGHAEYGWPAPAHAGDLDRHVDRYVRDRGHLAVRRILLQGRDHLVRGRGGGGAARRVVQALLGDRARGGPDDRVLHDAHDNDDLPRREPHR